MRVISVLGGKCPPIPLDEEDDDEDDDDSVAGEECNEDEPKARRCAPLYPHTPKLPETTTNDGSIFSASA